jgi:hypothetical protein
MHAKVEGIDVDAPSPCTTGCYKITLKKLGGQIIKSLRTSG